MASKLNAADIIENWPKRLEYIGIEKILIAVSFALLAVTMVRLGMNYGSLPAEIPTHYDFEGNVDGSDGKGSLLFLAGVDVACTLLMLVCGHFPGPSMCLLVCSSVRQRTLFMARVCMCT